MASSRSNCVWIILIGLMIMNCRFAVNHFAFHPDRQDLIPPDRLPAGVEERFVPTPDNEKLQCYWIPRSDSQRLLIYFHGNAGNIGHRMDDLLTLADMGLSVLGVGYRGYGRSTGRPSERGIYADGRAALAYGMKTLGFKQGQIILVGRSIGSTVAVETARQQTLAAVILVSPMTSGRAVGRAHGFGFLSHLAGDAFDNLSKIKTVHSPLLIIHGTADEVIPFDLGRQLFQAAGPPKQFVAVEGAHHNDLSIIHAQPYWQAVRAFLQGR